MRAARVQASHIVARGAGCMLPQGHLSAACCPAERVFIAFVSLCCSPGVPHRTGFSTRLERFATISATLLHIRQHHTVHSACICDRAAAVLFGAAVGWSVCSPVWLCVPCTRMDLPAFAGQSIFLSLSLARHFLQDFSVPLLCSSHCTVMLRVRPDVPRCCCAIKCQVFCLPGSPGRRTAC